MDASLNALSVADRILLAPGGVDTREIDRVLGTLMGHKLDYADLYFQYGRSEGWSLEEGIVKSGSFDIEQGVGVRAVSGEKTAFAYSDEITEAALEDAARATRAIADAGTGRSTAIRRMDGVRPLYRGDDPLAS